MTGSDNDPGEGLVFDIRSYAINDGPGIRTTVFLKGCNLHCAWCHNPEGIRPEPEKLYTRSKCIGCGTCVEACPERALTLGSDGITTDETRCTLCGTCAEVCPTMAFEMAGTRMTIAQVMEIVEKDRPLYEQSGGGVSFSGGEPLLQHRFLIGLLDECGRRGIHRVVDTAGHVATETLLEVAKRTDLFLYDLKHMDPGLHERWTGVSNALILSNLRALAGAGAAVILRIPVVAGVNDDPENALAAAAFIASLPGNTPGVHLLPYHPIARHKYGKLGRLEDFMDLEEPSADSLEEMAGIFGKSGITARVGG